MRPTRKRLSALRTIETVPLARIEAGSFLNFRSANSRLAARQLVTATASRRTGLGPALVPSGGVSSVSSG